MGGGEYAVLWGREGKKKRGRGTGDRGCITKDKKTPRKGFTLLQGLRIFMSWRLCPVYSKS